MSNLVNFRAYVENSTTTKLPSAPCRRLPRASLRSLPIFVQKAMDLERRSPAAAAVVEELIDEILARLNARPTPLR